MLCPGSWVATWSSPHKTPPCSGWLGFSSPALKWLRARTGWGDPGVAWSRVMAKFYLQPPHFTFTFPQTILLPPKCYIMFICSLHISLSLSTHHLAAIILHLPDHGMPPQDLPPPRPPSTERPLCVGIFPPIPPLGTIALWRYPHVKWSIKDLSQILTTALIFLYSNYFRQKYLEIASCAVSLFNNIWVRVEHSLQQPNLKRKSTAIQAVCRHYVNKIVKLW